MTRKRPRHDHHIHPVEHIRVQLDQKVQHVEAEKPGLAHQDDQRAAQRHQSDQVLRLGVVLSENRGQNTQRRDEVVQPERIGRHCGQFHMGFGAVLRRRCVLRHVCPAQSEQQSRSVHSVRHADSLLFDSLSARSFATNVDSHCSGN